MVMTAQQIVGLYRKRARRYDVSANLYYLLGFREWVYRRRAIAALQLKPGDTVVEIGCGTGLNFPLLQRAIGPGGRIVGVDMTDAMLEQARRRVIRMGWENVELVQTDAADFNFPADTAAILSTFALSLMPAAPDIIERGLAAGARWAVLDLKIPDNALRHLAPLFILLTRAFGVSREWAGRRPWQPIMQRLPAVQELYFGVSYIASNRPAGGHHES